MRFADRREQPLLDQRAQISLDVALGFVEQIADLRCAEFATMLPHRHQDALLPLREATQLPFHCRGVSLHEPDQGRVLHRMARRGLGDRRTDFVEQFVEGGWLDHRRRAGELRKQALVTGCSSVGDDRRCRAELAQHKAGPIPVHARHQHVEQDRIDPRQVFPEHLDAMRAIGGDQQLPIGIEPWDLAQQCANLGTIVDEEDGLA